VRYEAYGLNVQEALCRGTAVMVSRDAGIVERFDDALTPAILPSNVTSEQLVAAMRVWAADVDGWRQRAASTAGRLRSRSWDDMAAEIVAAATGASAIDPSRIQAAAHG
jgi:glycosyltransferase involved in cell wall biosynthesis